MRGRTGEADWGRVVELTCRVMKTGLGPGRVCCAPRGQRLRSVCPTPSAPGRRLMLKKNSMNKMTKASPQNLDNAERGTLQAILHLQPFPENLQDRGSTCYRV